MKKVILFLSLNLLILNFSPFYAEGESSGREFFELKKFSHSLKYFTYNFQAGNTYLDRHSTSGSQGDSGIENAGIAEVMLRDFSREYFEGFYSLEKNDFARSIKHFKRARRFWPEFFYTDFILARMYEENSDHKRAAKYYKAYLKKLKQYHNGEFRLSQGIIVESVAFPIEDYDIASKLIKWRMGKIGIDMDKVSLPGWHMTPREIFALALKLIVILIVWIIFLPYLLRIWARIRFFFPRPKGAWICMQCSAMNYDINKECVRCGDVPRR